MAVVLGTTGVPFTDEAVRRAKDAARGPDGGAVAVVGIARMHGFALGMPNPGLLPTRKEKQAQADLVQAAVRRLRGWAVDADGHVVVTRNAARAIARDAKRRTARVVVLQVPDVPRWRRVVEGDPARAVRRRLRGRCDVLVVAATGTTVRTA